MKTLPNVKAVREYVVSRGYLLSLSTAYNHAKSGLFRPQEDGTYSVKSVEKYARTHLKQMATGKREAEDNADIQREKIQEELRKIRLGNEKMERDAARERGDLVEFAQLERELAARARLFRNALEVWPQKMASHIAGIFGADPTVAAQLLVEAGLADDIQSVDPAQADALAAAVGKRIDELIYEFDACLGGFLDPYSRPDYVIEEVSDLAASRAQRVEEGERG